MPFPTSATRRSLASGLEVAQVNANAIKAVAQSYRAQMLAGPINASGLLSLLDSLRGSRVTLTAVSALPGMDGYAVEQLGASVAADFTAMLNAIEAAGSWIVANFPKDGAGYLLIDKFDAEGGRTERTFTTAQTAGLRALLDTLIAAIN